MVLSFQVIIRIHGPQKNKNQLSTCIKTDASPKHYGATAKQDLWRNISTCKPLSVSSPNMLTSIGDFKLTFVSSLNKAFFQSLTVQYWWCLAKCNLSTLYFLVSDGFSCSLIWLHLSFVWLYETKSHHFKLLITHFLIHYSGFLWQQNTSNILCPTELMHEMPPSLINFLADLFSLKHSQINFVTHMWFNLVFQFDLISMFWLDFRSIVVKCDIQWFVKCEATCKTADKFIIIFGCFKKVVWNLEKYYFITSLAMTIWAYCLFLFPIFEMINKIISVADVYF